MVKSKGPKRNGKGKPGGARRRCRISARQRRGLEFGRICELTDGRAVLWRRYGIGAAEAARLARAEDAGYLAYLKYLRVESPQEALRVKSAERRPHYYAAENARRRALAKERRKVRTRRTANACPTAAQLRDAWEHVGESHEATLRFGSLIEDLECYVDNSLKFNEQGDIVGRNQGIKGWLHDNAPQLYDRYTTVMRYKAMSKKLRQIAELKDPVSASAIIAPEGGKRDYVADEIAGAGAGAEIGGNLDVVDAGEGSADGDEERRVTGIGGCNGGKEILKEGSGTHDGGEEHDGAWACDGGGTHDGSEAHNVNRAWMVPELAIVRARAIWCEVIGGIADNPTSLVRRIDELVDPERVEDANMLAEWKAKYANEITLRTKSTWWSRLVERAG